MRLHTSCAHERVMQVMRNCSPTCLVVEGGGGGERAKKAEAGRLGCAVSSRRYGTSSVLIMERRPDDRTTRDC